MTDSSRVGNGNGKTNLWIVGIAIFAALFSAASWLTPRGDLQQFRSDSQQQMSGLETRLQAEIDTVRKSATNLEPISVHDEFERNVVRQLDRISSDVENLRTQVVRREEMTGRLAAIAAAIATVRDSINDIRKEFTGSYNIGKQLDNLQDQIKVLQQRVDSNALRNAGSPMHQ